MGQHIRMPVTTFRTWVERQGGDAVRVSEERIRDLTEWGELCEAEWKALDEEYDSAMEKVTATAPTRIPQHPKPEQHNA